MVKLFQYLYFSLLVLSSISLIEANVDPIEGRYSFSLTTFSPSGKLPQLEHAIKASTLGPPIIGISLPHRNEILLASIQTLPSPLMNDDGTSRFVKISKSILMGHTGVNADGRVLCEAAQRLSVEHTYTFNEEIPVNVLLEEMALLFQQYTMKPGCRPFGSCLIVASVNRADVDENGCCLFRIDPAGTVTKLDSVVFAGRGNRQKVVDDIIDSGCVNTNNIDESEKILAKILRNEYGHNKKLSDINRRGDRDRNIGSELMESPSLVFAKLSGVKKDLP